MKISLKTKDILSKFSINSGKVDILRNNSIRIPPSKRTLSKINNSFINIFKSLKLNTTNSASIIIPDKTRPLPNLDLLESIIIILKKNNFKRISLLIAYGNHKKHSPKLLKLPRKILKNIAFVHHNSRKKGNLVKVFNNKTKPRLAFRKFIQKEIAKHKGKHFPYLKFSELKALKNEFLRRSKKDLFINKTFIESDLKIILSDVKPHQIFGYSGGPKMILPGIADKNTIITNHLMRIQPKSKLGNTQGNLPRQESAEVAKRIKNTIFINTLSLERGKIAAWNISKHSSDYKKISKDADKIFKAKARKYDLVISVGLPPINLNLYQLTKVITPAAMSLKKNGKIVVLANVKEKKYDYQTTNERIYKLTIKRELPTGNEKIYLFSNLNPKTLKKTFLIPIDKKKLKKLIAENKRILLIPDGDLVVPV